MPGAGWFPTGVAAATLVGSSLYALLWAKLGSQLSSASDVGADGMSPEKVLFMCLGAAGLAAVFGLVHWNSKRVIARLTGERKTNKSTKENDYEVQWKAPYDSKDHNEYIGFKKLNKFEKIN